MQCNPFRTLVIFALLTATGLASQATYAYTILTLSPQDCKVVTGSASTFESAKRFVYQDNTTFHCVIPKPFYSTDLPYVWAFVRKGDPNNTSWCATVYNNTYSNSGGTNTYRTLDNHTSNQSLYFNPTGLPNGGKLIVRCSLDGGDTLHGIRYRIN